MVINVCKKRYIEIIQYSKWQLSSTYLVLVSEQIWRDGAWKEKERLPTSVWELSYENDNHENVNNQNLNFENVDVHNKGLHQRVVDWDIVH